MHVTQYPTDISQVRLVGILLIGTRLDWFAPFLQKSPLLHDFDGFVKEFQDSFGDIEGVRTTINKPSSTPVGKEACISKVRT